MKLSKPQEKNLALLRKVGRITYNRVDVYNSYGKYKPGPDLVRSRTKGAHRIALESLVRLGLAKVRADQGETIGFAAGRPRSRRWLAFTFTPVVEES